MRERTETVLADLIAIRAEQQPDLDVLTFERWSLGVGAGPDEVRTYATLHDHANRIAAPIDPRTRADDRPYTGLSLTHGNAQAVTLGPSLHMGLRAVFAACRRDLEPNFVPSYVRVVDEIPKTASEKPQEQFLLERFAPHGPGIFTEHRRS